MNINQLIYFKKISQCKTLSQAAQELYVSQPSLSKLISTLEKEFDTNLFDRKGRNIVLNENGKIFLKYADDILASAASLKSQLKNQQEKDRSVLNLGLFIGSALFPYIISFFRKKHQNIFVNIIRQRNRELCSLSETDLLISSEEDWEDMHCTVLSEEEILLAVPHDHPLNSRDTIDLSDLERENFILLCKGRPLRRACDRIFEQENVHPNIVLETNDTAMLRDLINLGFGFSFVPKKTWSHSLKDINLLHISRPVFTRQICMYVPKKTYQKPASLLFQQYLISYFKDLP